MSLDSGFTVRYTNIAKGLAILAMVFHHIIHNNPNADIFTAMNSGLLSLVGMYCKVCEPLLTLLSGYGLAKRYSQSSMDDPKDRNSYVLSHICKLYALYWSCLLLVYAIRFVFNQPLLEIYRSDSVLDTFLNIVSDVLGVSYLFDRPTMIAGWYFITIVIYYICFVPLYRFTKRLGKSALLLSALPLFIYVIVFYYDLRNPGVLYGVEETDNVLFYLSSFVLGIYLCQNSVLDRMVIKSREKAKIKDIVMIAGFIVLSLVLRLFINVAGDILVAVSVLLVAIFVLAKSEIVSKALVSLGKQSANIWLIHVTVYRTIRSILKLEDLPLYLLSMVTAYLLSLLLNWLKKKSGYNDLMEKLSRKVI